MTTKTVLFLFLFGSPRNGKEWVVRISGFGGFFVMEWREGGGDVRAMKVTARVICRDEADFLDDGDDGEGDGVQYAAAASWLVPK
jgi:hypothetical protein